ncbi:MAG: GntR family histidine utilization transcriptional repressor [Woeseiaceae bacterium]|jgi:GntR family histidine utilization transcriptional repressor|tara:strand:+ start:4741 stop:5487 length:747 start_codon:yes stop_codon:yes gene_type:complete
MMLRKTPRYQQLKELIIDQISSGALKPSQRVPSENQLVVSMGVSRMTANRALRELNDEGYLDRKAGVGSFVSDLKATSHLLEVRNIADEVKSRGHEYSSRVIKHVKKVVPKDIAKAMNINKDMEVAHILLVHYENDIPIQIEDRFVDTSFAPGFMKQDFSLVTPSAYLSGIAPLQEAEQVVKAVIPENAISNLLQIDQGQPCLLITRRTWVLGKPVTYGRFFHPGDRYELIGHYKPPQEKNITTLNKL